MNVATGSGRGGRKAFLPKGRQVDDIALGEVEALIGGMPKRPDLLIEFLHKLQDYFGCLHARHMNALAAILRLSQAEIYEVASFLR